jgi:hypothetical protein
MARNAPIAAARVTVVDVAGPLADHWDLAVGRSEWM